MVCQNCNAETNGIKIKGRLFCTDCGELLNIEASLDPEPKKYESQATADTEPVAKVIDQEGNIKKIENEINLLEAEEEVLAEIEKVKIKKPKKKIKITKTDIKKHNRPRIVGTGKNAFKVYQGEPDPVNEPELEPPHDALLAEPTELITEVKKEVKIDLASPDEAPGHALLDPKTREEIEAKRIQHQKLFLNFLKSGTSQATTVKKQKKSKVRTLKLTTYIGGGFIVILLLAGLIFYMNNYGFNAEYQTVKAEKTAALDLSRPQIIIPGYELSYLTKGEPGAISYVYEYKADTAKGYEINIQKSELTQVELHEQKVKPLKTNFVKTAEKGIDFWQVGKNDFFFITKGNLYHISSKTPFSYDEFITIARGLI